MAQDRREARDIRRTDTTEVEIWVDLDGGPVELGTGLPYFDRLLVEMAHAGKLGLEVRVECDVPSVGHRVMRDVGIVFGKAVRSALDENQGIERIGVALVPVGEALARAVIDLEGRPAAVWAGEPSGVYRPELAISELAHFVTGFAHHAGAALHVDVLRGADYHDVVEAAFRAIGRALRAATRTHDPASLPPTVDFLD